MAAHSVTAQEARLNAPSTAGLTANEFLGVDRCRDCHRAATPERVTAGVTDFLSLNESAVWVSDIHSKAFELIDPAKSALGKQICDKLGITNIHKSRECLSCHSDWRPEAANPPPTYERGVACESCHGASQKWDLPHSKADWRAKPVADKFALGMIDVRNPIKRAEQCFGCHIGSAAEGKVVTHAMYAAGHPPLPSIEIESFAAQMPRHWRYLEEKLANDKAPFTHFDDFVHENHSYLNVSDNSLKEGVATHKHRAAAVVLGGAIALREYVELIWDLASSKESEQRAWPELAAFDCRACHHELESPSRWQQQRFGSLPGRPTLPDWPAALVPLAISHASASPSAYEKQLAEFRAKLSAVQTELERTPFGSPAGVQKACTALLDWLEGAVIEPALARPFEGRAVTESFLLLSRIGSEETHDFDSARQIAWAMRMLSCGIANDELRKAIHDSLETLTSELRLNLSNGPGEQCAPVATIDEARQLTALAADLPQSLAAPIEYNPDRFQKQMQNLRELLPAKAKSTK